MAGTMNYFAGSVHRTLHEALTAELNIMYHFPSWWRLPLPLGSLHMVIYRELGFW